VASRDDVHGWRVSGFGLQNCRADVRCVRLPCAIRGKDAVNRPFAACIAVTIVCGLALDSLGPRWSQPAVDWATWMLFGALLWRSPPPERIALAACLLFATAGEIFLALVWRVYDYRLGNLPLFVPPGHVLLYALGWWLCRRVPMRAMSAACALIALAAIVLAIDGRDQLSIALTALFVLCMRYGPSPRLYATMFVLALTMELWGTWLGNWTWRSQAPWLGWHTLNPPFAAGAFYCVLDWLVGLVRRAQSERLAPQRPT
jgi:hypothetical protein